MNNKLLEVNNLKTHFLLEEGVLKAVDGVSFSLNKGETLAIVGESGSGKSVTSLSIMRLITPPGKITSGSIIFNGDDLLKYSQDEIRKIRGDRISLIFQDPFTSLNPVLTMGEQLTEGLIIHKNMDKNKALETALKILKKVHIADPEKRIKSYPHELSGGMRQRVMIAMALICNPEIIIADEPTTALDVTIQAQILELMRELKDELDSSIILITHNLGIVADFCDKVLVMYAGSILEEAPVNDIFNDPFHPYTKALLKCLPRLDTENKGELPSIKGQPPELINAPAGCRFAGRCEKVMDICREKIPDLLDKEKNRKVRCWLYDNKH
ncbi:MAG: ABC transporter ATP-binding protein [Armatimonadota bacterium]